MAVSTELAEVALEDVADVDQELLPERQMQAELDPHLLVDVGRRPLADRRQHRIDRHHPADHEGDQQQAEEGERERGDEAQHPVRDGAGGRRMRACAGRPPLGRDDLEA